MEARKDITGINDIKLLVDDFYSKVKKDNLLSPIFFKHIPVESHPNLDKMSLFWNAALFGEKGYLGNPFSKHAKMDTITLLHFERWLLLFNETVDAHFLGSIAEDAKWRASIMADNFMRRLTSLREKGTITIV